MLTPVLARLNGASGDARSRAACWSSARREFRDLLARHGTREQARFFLAQRGLAIADVEERHLRHEEVRARVLGAIPPTWRTATVQRADLDRFLFAADDIVVVLGQDGLVANVAKYLDGQPVIGLNPEPERFPGVLVNQRAGGDRRTCAPTSPRAARASSSARWSAPRSTTARSCSRSTRSSSATAPTSPPATSSTVGERERAPVLVRADRRDRHRRDRLGDEHQPPARAPLALPGADGAASSRGSCARRGRARRPARR